MNPVTLLMRGHFRTYVRMFVTLQGWARWGQNIVSGIKTPVFSHVHNLAKELHVGPQNVFKRTQHAVFGLHIVLLRRRLAGLPLHLLRDCTFGRSRMLHLDA